MPSRLEPYVPVLAPERLHTPTLLLPAVALGIETIRVVMFGPELICSVLGVPVRAS